MQSKRKRSRSKLIRFLMSKPKEDGQLTRKQIIALAFKIAFLEAMALSLILPSVTSTGEVTNPNACFSTNSNCNTQISFVTAVFGNASALNNAVILSSVTTGIWSATANQTMIVVTQIGETLQTSTLSVLSVTDLFGDTFQKQVGFSYNPLMNPEGSILEVWSGVTKLFGINSITVNLNNTVNEIQVQASIYSGVAGIVQSKITNNGSGGVIPSLTITTTTSGSWILGTSLQASPTTCNSLGPGTLFTKRINTCNTDNPKTSYLTDGEIDDNATALRNSFTLTYTPTSGTIGQQNIVAVIEMSAIDKEPLNPDFSQFCTVTNSPCIEPTVTVQILFIPVIASRTTTTFLTIMYATPIASTISVSATFQWFAHNATFAFTESGSNSCTINANALSCSVTTTFPTAFIGVPNVIASSTTPSKTVVFPT